MKLRFGPWRQVSECLECHRIVATEVMWMTPFYVAVCSGCGASNSGLGIFEARTARRATTWWGRFVRWDFKDE